MRVARWLLAVSVVLVLAGCTANNGIGSVGRTTAPPTVTSSSSSSPAAPRTSSAPSRPARPAAHTLRPRRGRTTRQGFWWGVDSTVPIDLSSLGNVHSFYRGHRVPVTWGRYVLGTFAMSRAEMRFAAAHDIALYVLVPDDNCSGCGGGDACGNDITAAQARADAHNAIVAARRLRLPRGVALFKDVEQVGSCSGELTGEYLDAWFRRVSNSPYPPAFYGNSTGQDYDFPRAFCAAVRQDRRIRRVLLAQDEPEPAIGAPSGSIGPSNAPPFRPEHPSCVKRQAIDVWQYGESLSGDNVTDVDLVRPGTPGLLAPDGRPTTRR